MLIRNAVLAALAGLALAIGADAAMAQSAPACQADDLRCRIERLEARLAALEAAPPARAQAPAPARTVYVAPTETIQLRRTCRTDCRAEAQEVCIARGFVGGAPEDWERPRAGPVTLTRAECARAQN